MNIIMIVVVIHMMFGIIRDYKYACKFSVWFLKSNNMLMVHTCEVMFVRDTESILHELKYSMIHILLSCIVVKDLSSYKISEHYI
jgi:hypothetical protein